MMDVERWDRNAATWSVRYAEDKRAIHIEGPHGGICWLHIGMSKEDDIANANLIVKCVNSYEELVGLMEECREDLVKYRDTAKGWWPEGYDMTQKRIDRIDAALAKSGVQMIRNADMEELT